jgi:hypothetical protein
MELKTNNGYTYWIDDEDLSLISAYHWYGYTPKKTKKDGRISHYSPFIQANIKEKGTTVRLHRLLLNDPVGVHIDHVDGDRCNNRKNNLRCCTRSQNNRNRIRHYTNTSGFKGVTWHARAKKWQAQLSKTKGKSYIGLFNTKEEAATAYNKAALEWHGEFAKLNDVKEEVKA